MKMRKVGVVIAALLFVLSFSFVSYAYEDVPESDWEVCFYYGEDSVLMPENVISSNSMENVQPRGTLISTALTQIFNAGGGKIDVLIETLAHVTVDEIRPVSYTHLRRTQRRRRRFPRAGRSCLTKRSEIRRNMRRKGRRQPQKARKRCVCSRRQWLHRLRMQP